MDHGDDGDDPDKDDDNDVDLDNEIKRKTYLLSFFSYSNWTRIKNKSQNHHDNHYDYIMMMMKFLFKKKS